MDTNFEPRPIHDLLGKRFFIPSYQRGYRWEEQQVTDLLDDIWEFKKEGKEGEFYCLQPIVVKKKEDDTAREIYEVIDGQQRLTAIFLILKHLEKFVESDIKNFTLEYETRNTENRNSSEFLKNVQNKRPEEAEENIDYFYIHKSYQEIQKWFKKKANEGNPTTSSDCITPFMNRTTVLWYEVDKNKDNKDTIDIFTRINAGKITLTNAELIKALFLNRSNFKDSNSEELRLKQLQIATEWDRIENTLQNESFWAFIYNGTKQYDSRIEYIFDLMAKKKEGIEYEFYTFRKFSKDFEKGKNEQNKKIGILDENWKKIKDHFQTFEEWHNDHTLYHLVGYTVNAKISGGDVGKLKGYHNELTTKEKFEYELRNIIKKEVHNWLKSNNDIDELDKESKHIKEILLLHNIETMLQDQESRDQNSRFPFDRYKNVKWSIEHIHALNAEGINNKEDFEILMSDIKAISESELKEEVEKIASTTPDLTQKCKSINILLEDIRDNSIRNLALLTQSTNSTLNNKVFYLKRRDIIVLGQGGAFIPPCTRNVFLKRYTPYAKQLIIWEENDKGKYMEDIKTKLKKYLPERMQNEQ